MMRHAKSSWTSGASTDHARPLNKRGKKAAAAMGPALMARGWLPDRVISSDSTRTQETLRRMALPDGADVVFAPELYHGEIDDVRRAIGGQSDPMTLLLLGHEPGWSASIAWLTGTQIELKTADAALLTARRAVDWRELVAEAHRFQLDAVLRSRQVVAERLSQSGKDVVL